MPNDRVRRTRGDVALDELDRPPDIPPRSIRLAYGVVHGCNSAYRRLERY